MPSSFTTSLRFELQFTGENINVWGEKLNAVISRTDTSIAGWFTKALTSNYSLTTANGTADEARNAMLKFTGTGAYIVTIPAVSKRYDVWNACTDVLTVSNGSASITVQVGEVVSVVTDGGGNFKRVLPTDFGGATLTAVARVTGLSPPTANSDAATKKYVDDAAFNSVDLPGQSGNAGKFLTTNGATASWGWAVTAGAGLATVSNNTVTVAAASAAEVRTGTSTTKAATPDGMADAVAFGTLNDGPSVSWSITTHGVNVYLAMTASGRVIGFPTGLWDGCPVILKLGQPAGGGCVPVFHANYEFTSTPSVNTGANKVDYVFGVYDAARGKLICNYRRAP